MLAGRDEKCEIRTGVPREDLVMLEAVASVLVIGYYNRGSYPGLHHGALR